MNRFWIAIAAVAVVCGIFAGCNQRKTPDSLTALQSAQKTEWKLPGPVISWTGLFVSSDRKFALMIGLEGEELRSSLWRLDLQTGQVENILPEGAALLRCSRDGRRIAFGGLWYEIHIKDLSTGKEAVFNKGTIGYPGHMEWAGDHLLVSEPTESPLKAYYPNGSSNETKVFGEILGSDIAGQRLLVRTYSQDSIVPCPEGKTAISVVSPTGNLLRVLAVSSGDFTAIISRKGEFALLYFFRDSDKSQVISIETGETFPLPVFEYPEAPFAIADTGEMIAMNSFKLVLWSKDGKRADLADNVVTGTFLNKEIFFIQFAGEDTYLKAIPFPR